MRRRDLLAGTVLTTLAPAASARIFRGSPTSSSGGGNVPTSIQGTGVPWHNLSETGVTVGVAANGSGSVATPVTGTITLATRGPWFYGGAPSAGTYTAQWYVDDKSVGPQLTEFTTGLPPILSLSVNTLTAFSGSPIPDGTHAVWVQFLDHTAYAAYFLDCFGVYIIVHNSGYVNGAQTVAVTHCFDGVGRRQSPVRPDFVSYGGTPNPTQTGFPFGSTGFIAPSPGAALFVELLNANRCSEYLADPRWSTLSPLETGAGDGGVWCQSITPEVSGFSTVATGYIPSVAYNPSDGERCDNVGIGLITIVEAPDGNSVYFVGIQGNLCRLDFTGEVTTIAGFTQDKSLLTYNQAITDEATIRSRQTLVGNFPADVDLGGATDLCFDPRDGTGRSAYVVSQLDNIILFVDMSTTPATVSVFAGTGANGYHDDTDPQLAVFDQPNSIIMTDGVLGPDPAGTMYVADWNNCVIRKIAPVSIGVAGAVTTFLGTEATKPSRAAVAASQPGGGGVSTYSPATNVSFGSAVIPYPFTLRFNSVGDIILFENITMHVRRINLVTSPTNNVVSLGWFGATNPNQFPAQDAWGWMDVDTIGAIFAVDTVVIAQVYSGDGQAEFVWKLDPPFTTAGTGIGGGFAFPDQKVAAENPFDEQGWAHYPWAVAFSRHQGRAWFTGSISNSIYQVRVRQSDDPQTPFSGPYTNFQTPPMMSGNYGYLTGTVSGRGAGTQGWPNSLAGDGNPHPFPWNIRPGYSIMRGQGFQGHLGAWPGLNTSDDIDATYPTDAALRAYIVAGMGSPYPRPELTGNDARDLIYWLRFNTVRGAHGSGGTAVQPGADDPDTGNFPTITLISAIRNSTTSITVSWSTNKPTIGYAMAGTLNQASQNPPFCCFSPIENFTVPYSGNPGGGLIHSATVIVPSGATPLNYSCCAKDEAGNAVYASTQTII